jgi:ABC-type phosphonate transport system ATPase subunit
MRDVMAKIAAGCSIGYKISIPEGWTSEMAVARLMADRLMVMKSGAVVETGLTDQVLDDPQHPYTQLLVSSVLQI